MNTLIYGGGHLGCYLYRLMKLSPDKYNVLGFIDDSQPVGKEILDCAKIVGNFGYLATVNHSEISLVLGIGYSRLQERYRCYERCKDMGFSFSNIVHPHASIGPEVNIGEGNIILDGAVVDQNVTIGNANFIDMNCSISHDNSIGDNNFLTVGFSSAGFVTIGNNNFIGMNSSITDHVKIGNDNFISAGNLISTKVGDSRKVVTVFQQVILDYRSNNE